MAYDDGQLWAGARLDDLRARLRSGLGAMDQDGQGRVQAGLKLEEVVQVAQDLEQALRYMSFAQGLKELRDAPRWIQNLVEQHAQFLADQRVSSAVTACVFYYYGAEGTDAAGSATALPPAKKHRGASGPTVVHEQKAKVVEWALRLVKKLGAYGDPASAHADVLYSLLPIMGDKVDRAVLDATRKSIQRMLDHMRRIVWHSCQQGRQVEECVELVGVLQETAELCVGTIWNEATIAVVDQLVAVILGAQEKPLCVCKSIEICSGEILEQSGLVAALLGPGLPLTHLSHSNRVRMVQTFELVLDTILGQLASAADREGTNRALFVTSRKLLRESNTLGVTVRDAAAKDVSVFWTLFDRVVAFMHQPCLESSSPLWLLIHLLQGLLEDAQMDVSVLLDARVEPLAVHVRAAGWESACSFIRALRVNMTLWRAELCATVRALFLLLLPYVDEFWYSASCAASTTVTAQELLAFGFTACKVAEAFALVWEDSNDWNPNAAHNMRLLDLCKAASSVMTGSEKHSARNASHAGPLDVLLWERSDILFRNDPTSEGLLPNDLVNRAVVDPEELLLRGPRACVILRAGFNLDALAVGTQASTGKRQQRLMHVVEALARFEDHGPSNPS
ncbi:hypothetical protein FVE85_3885 [Porphyridium purpureum]|uniref:Uncharacterized protein n=1 Tax=Porphyridium purpureum TaxID=35688 RepID=A0A5J4YSM2_PORPP|nr:hypothetical protein FVE85_3885 [Porphyridium purpureum]|eukprot:POR3811..scf229_5